MEDDKSHTKVIKRKVTKFRFGEKENNVLEGKIVLFALR